MFGSVAQPRSATSRIGNLLLDRLVHLWERLDWAWRLRISRRELLRLDDRLLADIGMSRDDIDPVIQALARSFTPGASR